MSHFFNLVFALLLYSSLSFFVSASARVFPPLPEAVTNNAVASVHIDNKQYVFSFMGLASGKTYKDVHNKAWQLRIDKKGVAGDWQVIPAVPSSLALKGRLASVAVGVNASVYLFGGYTVAEDHSEISTPDVYQYSPLTKSYKLLAPMPVPVDDAVALVYQKRFVYLISGWHNDGNVNLVQVYDLERNLWQQASPYLGKPVFGHAGSMVGNTMLICDGVAVVPRAHKRRTFAAETACYKGIVDTANHLKIDWRVIQHPTGVARYRMASSGDDRHKRILFVGGSVNPYNYNGIGYDGKASEPDNKIWSFDVQTDKWTLTESAAASMDHRGLIKIADKWVTIGGMGSQQSVSDLVIPHLQ